MKTPERKYSHFIRIFVFLVAIGTGAQTAAQQDGIDVDTIRTDNGILLVSFHADRLFTDGIIESMNKGISISIDYQVTLWRKRGSWFDESLDDVEIPFKVKYDKFDRRYTWMSLEERRTTRSFDTVRELCTVVTDIPLAETADLQPEQSYYITVKGILQPHSIENMDDVREWLSGEIEDVELEALTKPRRSQERLTTRLFNIVKNITGFGDRTFSGTSLEFTLTPNGKITILQR